MLFLCVSLTGCHAFGAVADVIVVAVFLHAENGGHTAGRAQTLAQVGGCWEIGVHAIWRGHVVARDPAISMGHLFFKKSKKQRKPIKMLASTNIVWSLAPAELPPQSVQCDDCVTHNQPVSFMT